MENIITIRNQVAPATSGSHLEGMVGSASSSGAAAAKGGKAQTETAKGIKKLANPSGWKKIGKTLGISLGFATLLKQSQAFTSTLGILFQMAGAIADVMLAPALPYIMKAIIPMFKIGMNVGKSIGMIIKLGLEGLVGYIKLVDWFYTKFFPFYPEVKDLIKKFGDGRILNELIAKGSEWVTKKTGEWIPTLQEFMEKIVNWFISKLPKFLGGGGQSLDMPSLNLMAKAAKYVFPKVLPTKGSQQGIQVVRDSLGITALDVSKIYGAASEVESRRQTEKYGFSFGATGAIGDAILDGIKMDDDMTRNMKKNSTGFGGGGHAY